MNKYIPHATKGARILLGLIYFVFGLNGFLNFIPTPPPPESVANLMGAWMQTGYFIPVLKATEVTCGLLLIIGLYAPLALIILAPITLQILLFHIFLTPGVEFLIMPIFMIILQLAAAHAYRDLYRPLLRARH